MPQPLVWQRRQEIPPQQMTTGPTPIEGENECNDSTPITKSRVGAIQHLYHGGGQKLLCLWKIWAHGPVLQEQGAEGRLMDERRLEYRERREGNYKHSNNLKEEENSETLN